MTIAAHAMKPAQNWNKAMTLRQFLHENFGWDIYDWEIDDIRF